MRRDKNKKYGSITPTQKELMEAIDRNDLEEVKRIVGEGCNPNFETEDGIAHSPIYLAILKGNLDMVLWLIDEGGVNINEKTLHWALVVVGNPSISRVISDILEKKK